MKKNNCIIWALCVFRGLESLDALTKAEAGQAPGWHESAMWLKVPQSTHGEGSEENVHLEVAEAMRGARETGSAMIQSSG